MIPRQCHNPPFSTSVFACATLVKMAEQQEFYSSERSQTLDSFTGQQQSSTGSSSVGFGGGGKKYY